MGWTLRPFTSWSDLKCNHLIHCVNITDEGEAIVQAEFSGVWYRNEVPVSQKLNMLNRFLAPVEDAPCA